MTEKFRDMDIFCKDNRKMLLFNQFDLGAQYEIFTKYVFHSVKERSKVQKRKNIMKNAAIEKAAKDKVALSKEYGVPTSSVVWMGDNHYIVVKDGVEIRV